MKVVIVNESVPYPPTAGNRIRTLNLMLRLAQRHQVTYLCRAAETARDTEVARSYLKEHGITMVVGDAAPTSKKGLGFCARLVGNMFCSQPYAVASHNSPGMRAAIRKLAQEGNVDLRQFEWLAYADALQGVTRAPSLVFAHNVESLIWQRYVQTETNPIKRLYLREQWRKFRAYERGIFRQVSGVVCVSPEDARLASSEFDARRVWVVDNGIDREFFAQAKAQREPRTILFLGSLDWRPNQDAIRQLLDTILPRVLQEEPEAKLCIVGRKPPEWLLSRVAGMANVQLHGDVKDVRPYLAKASVMAVPLRVGGGSRLKILEAMACGLPVVSTTVGYEGLALTPGRELIVADEPEAFARQLVQSLRAPEKVCAMAEAGRQLVYEQYDWNVLASRLESAWEQAVQEQLRPVAEVSAGLGKVQPALG